MLSCWFLWNTHTRHIRASIPFQNSVWWSAYNPPAKEAYWTTNTSTLWSPPSWEWTAPGAFSFSSSPTRTWRSCWGTPGMESSSNLVCTEVWRPPINTWTPWTLPSRPSCLTDRGSSSGSTLWHDRPDRSPRTITSTRHQAVAPSKVWKIQNIAHSIENTRELEETEMIHVTLTADLENYFDS